MIYILSWTTKQHQKTSFQATTFKVEENSRTFQDCANPVKWHREGILGHWPEV